MKKISWWEPQIGKHEHRLINKVLSNNFPNEGKLTEEFENKIAYLLKIRYAVAVTSATAGMFLSLKALGIGHGDEVIVPDLTFIATANAVEMTGAKAILADVEEGSLTLDPNCFEKAITRKTKAVIPVHVSGRAANLKKIEKIAVANNIFIIEDAAEAFMSKYNGKYLGTFGSTGCFSFSPAKTITTGQGGMIVTDNINIYKSLKMLKDQGRPTRGTGGDDIHYGLGFNFKFTDLQSAVGLGQLKYLTKRIERMKKNYYLYQKLLKNIDGITVYKFNIDDGELPQWTDALVDNRTGLDTYLKKNKVDCRRFWHPIHSQKYYKSDDIYFPKSVELSPKLLWLPSSFTLSDSDIKYVCKLIKDFLSNAKNN